MEILDVLELILRLAALLEGGRGCLRRRLGDGLTPLLVDQEIPHVHLYVEIVLPVVGQELIEVGCVEEHKVEHQPRFHTKLIVQLLHGHPCQLRGINDLY